MYNAIRVFTNLRTGEEFREQGMDVSMQQLAWLIHKSTGDSFHFLAVSLDTGEVLNEEDWI